MTERIPTFIEGFDERISGGIPKGNVILVSGEPGTMKSSICYSILFNNAIENDMSGAFVSLEQGREGLISHMDGLGFNLSSVQEKVSIVDLGLIRKNLDKLGQQTWMQIFKMYTKNLKESMGFEILVIDSLPVLEMLSEAVMTSNPRPCSAVTACLWSFFTFRTTSSGQVASGDMVVTRPTRALTLTPPFRVTGSPTV